MPCVGIRRQGGRMTVFGGKRSSGDGGLRGERMARDRFSLMPFFIGSLQFICSGVFSHPDKVRRERFSAVAFSGSRPRIFPHRLFARLLKIHPAESLEIPLSCYVREIKNASFGYKNAKKCASDLQKRKNGVYYNPYTLQINENQPFSPLRKDLTCPLKSHKKSKSSS